MSCMNDGLQVSTGSTLGRGLISVSTNSPATPEAQFTFAGKSISIGLKPEYLQKIQQDINMARERFGQAPEYWQAVRETALRYWSGWDRHQIFDIWK